MNNKANNSRSDFPRKRRHKRNLVLVGVCAFAAVSVYIGYAMSIPEEEPFKEITPKVTSSGSWALQDGVTEGGGESSSTSVIQAMKQDGQALMNPLEAAVGTFDSKWSQSYKEFSKIADKQDNIAMLSKTAALLDIAHADIVEVFEPFLNLASTSTGWGDAASDAVVNSQGEGQFTFSKTLDGDTTLEGKFNQNSGAFYCESKNGSKLVRLVEVIPVDLVYYVKLVETNGPYKGINSFLLSENEFRCSKLDSIDGLQSFYDAPPKSWQQFVGDSNRVFVFADSIVSVNGKEYK